MKTALSLSERARAYISKISGAVSGSSGHNRTFAVACKLVEFGLTWDEAWALLLEYNQRCLPPWTEKELEHKLRDAFRLAHLEARYTPKASQPYAAKPQPKIDPATATENFLKGFRCEEADMWEASPVRPPEDWTKDGALLVAMLFEPGDLVNVVVDYTVDKNGKANPAGWGITLPRDQMVRRLQKGDLHSEAGAWLRMNPLDGRGVSNPNVTAMRFALLECDHVPAQLQLSLFARLPLPIAAILSSGGRSAHAWVKLDAKDHEDYERTVDRMRTLLMRFGVDHKNKNPSRLSRLPGIQRTIGAAGDGRQRLIYLNPEPEAKTIL